MSGHNSLVATYANHHLAEHTVKKLQQAGFDLHKLTIIGKDPDFHAAEGAAMLDSLNRLDETQHACIPPEYLPDYAAELGVDRLLLFVHGSAEEIAQAKAVIDTSHPERWDGKVGCNIYYGCPD